jgi:hypothetical protein
MASTEYIDSSDSRWRTWTSGAYTVKTAVYQDTAWTSWTDSTAAVSNAATTTAWKVWTRAGVTYSSDYRTATATTTAWTVWTSGADIVNVRQETEAERTVREERYRQEQEQARVAAEKRAKEAEEREKKALILLQLVLNEQQKKELKEKNYFEVGVVGGKKYRIKKGQCRNIQELDDKTGNVKRTLCFHPQDNLHDYDAMAIQKLALESMEEEALKVANFS